MGDRLIGKRIIITGAAANIGRVVVEAFVAEGARVVIGDIDDRAAGVAERHGGAARFVRTDVEDEGSIARLMAEGVEWLGGLDVLCQNAGIQRSGYLVDFSPHDWDRVFVVNVRAQFLGAKHAVPHLRKSGRGVIINTASSAGRRGGPGIVAYAASKGAVIAFTTSLALELARDDIRVNAVCPGWVDTDFNAAAIALHGGRSAADEVVARTVPMRRQGVPSEIAPLFVYLASDESTYMTAQSVVIDGGAYNP